MGKFKNFVNNIKNLFSYDTERTIKEIGAFPLGTNPLTSITKYIPNSELLVLGDFIRCVQIISNDFAKVDILHYKKKNKKSNFNRVPNSIYEFLLNESPNNEISGFEFKKVLIWNLFLYGSAAVYVERDENNKVISLIPVYRNFIKRYVENGEPKYILNLSGTTSNWQNLKDKPRIEKGEILLNDEDIIWFTYELLDNFKNVEFRTLYTMSLNKLKENDLSTLNSFKNDVGLSLFVKLKDASNAEQRKRVAETLRETFQNYKQNGYLAFCFDDKIEVSANDKFVNSPISLEMRKYVASEITSRFGIPSAFLGIETPNQSISQLTQIYIDKGLEPLIKSITSKLSYHFFKHSAGSEKLSYSILNFSGLDAEQKIKIFSQAINNGILTPNEAREMLGLEPKAEGDSLRINSSIYEIGTLQETQEKNINETNEEKLI